MTSLIAEPRSARAFVLVAVAFMINMIGTTLPTSIYRYYQQQYGFTPTIITVIRERHGRRDRTGAAGLAHARHVGGHRL